MDKYLLVILVFLIVGIPIAFITPSTGEIREQPIFGLFWASIAGIIIVVLYSSYKERQARRRANAERRRKSKK